MTKIRKEAGINFTIPIHGSEQDMDRLKNVVSPTKKVQLIGVS
jgi:hypothetical protein